MDRPTTESFRQLNATERYLKEKIWKFDNSEQILRQKISEKEYQINQLKGQIEMYGKKSRDMQERIQKAKEIPRNLLEKRKSMDKDIMKRLFSHCISIVERKLQSGLNNFFQCPSSVEENDGEMNREAFKVYGLLLSACPQLKTIVEKVTQFVEDKNILGNDVCSKKVAKVYVTQAVKVTYSMLTLLPPLIVTVHLREYSHILHDTNRLTWDESTERIDELIYYRPILVYGNHLNVAVKGLVGNSKRELGDQNRELLQKQQSIPQQGETQSTQGVISYKTKAIDAREHISSNECAVCHSSKGFDFIDCSDVHYQQHKVHKECYMCIMCTGVSDATLRLVGNQLFCKNHLKKCKAAGCQKYLQWKESNYNCDEHGNRKLTDKTTTMV